MWEDTVMAKRPRDPNQLAKLTENDCMTRKKAAVIAGAVLTCPLTLVVGFLLAEPFYMKFAFEGDRRDFAPGDAIGVLFYGILFSVPLFLASVFGWWRVYKRISN